MVILHCITVIFTERNNCHISLVFSNNSNLLPKEGGNKYAMMTLCQRVRDDDVDSDTDDGDN